MAEAEPTDPLLQSLRQLETVLGRSPVPDYTDGHARWDLYRVAIGVPEAYPILFRATCCERDTSLAAGVVGPLLERLAPEERNAWVQVLDPAVRGFSVRRVRELDVLEAVTSRNLTAHEAQAAIDGWSDWLQLRVIAASDDTDILRLLSELGRTKRIRNTALSALS
ncbi:hypothetical protein [Streptomyces sp. NPDC029004]|uniref:hypothetical protein n=1 Tax=Streptomyces sp. NPDC029004 TaxID=3154490 RepID=UPI003400A719